MSARVLLWALALCVAASVTACIPCGGADECCDTNGTVLPNAPRNLCR